MTPQGPRAGLCRPVVKELPRGLSENTDALSAGRCAPAAGGFARHRWPGFVEAQESVRVVLAPLGALLFLRPESRVARAPPHPTLGVI